MKQAKYEWFGDDLHTLFFTMLCTVLETRLVLNSRRIHADFIFTLNFEILCAIMENRLVLNSC